MGRFYRVLLIVLGLSASPVLAQLPTRIPQLPGGGAGGNRMGGGASGGSARGANGTLIDDSTKMIYGPKTTRYFLESDVLNNRKALFTLDTLLEGIHQYNFVNRNNNLYIDLGNLGTALRPVFYQTPEVGAQTGFYVYRPYGYNSQNIRYFDTRSPYTNMYLVLGGNGQNILNFDFTQNISPRLNVGFNVQRMTSDLQFGGSSSNVSGSQRLIQNWNFVAHGNYRSKDKKYTLLAHFNNLNHNSIDQGGLLGDVNITAGGLSSGSPILVNAQSREVRNTLHLYHQYVLRPAFQAYQILDYGTQYYRFDDYALNTSLDNGFYQAKVYYDSLSTAQRTRFRLIENQAGLKGQFSTGKSAFNYRAWMRQRIYGLLGEFNIGRFLPDSSYRTRRFENFVGGWLGYYFPDSLTRATAEVEYLVGRDFRLQGRLESRFLTAGYESVFASPTLIQEKFISNNYQWDNNFGLRGTQHIYGQLNVKLGKFTLQPGLDYFLLNNYIYFDTAAVPRQASGAFSVARTGLGWQLKAGKFTALGQGYYTLVSRTDLLRIPQWFANARFEYDFLLFKKLYVLAGIELHYKSSYYADAYMPLTEQYHLQNKTLIEQYVVGDAFLNFRINRVRLFLKAAHANQGFWQSTYFTAPNYPGMGRSIAFGVHWLLFD